MKLLFLLSLIFLCACGSKQNNTIEKDKGVFSYSYSVHGENSGKRVFLAHGFGGKSKDYLTAPGFNHLFNGLIAKGYQVILFDYSIKSDSVFKNASLEYRKEYEAFLNWLFSEVEANHGEVSEIVFGGISLGGLHTLMAVILSEKIDSYFVVVPVVELKALTELKQIDSSNFNPLNEVEKLAQKPGIILYDNTDMRVDFNFTIQLVNELNSFGATLDVIERNPSIGHKMTRETAEDILNFL